MRGKSVSAISSRPGHHCDCAETLANFTLSLLCIAHFLFTSWKVVWSVAITERLSPVSNHRKRVNYSGEDQVAIRGAHFVEGLLQEHVQLKKASRDP
jgi:hypothetical protein